MTQGAVPEPEAKQWQLPLWLAGAAAATTVVSIAAFEILMGAALLAAKILGLADPAVRQRVEAMQRENVDVILRDDAALKTQAG